MKLVMVITAITMFLHICGGALVNARALSKCKINKKEIALGLIVCLAVPFFVFNVDMSADKYAVICFAEALCVCIGSMAFRGADRRLSLFLAISYEFVAVLFTKLLALGFVILTKDAACYKMLEAKGSYVNLAGSVIIMAAFFLLFVLKKVSNKFLMRVGSVFAILAMAAINFITSNGATGIDNDEIFSLQYYAIFILVSILVFQMRRQYDAEKEIARTKENEAMILEREYQSLSRSYENNAKLFHDFRNHCGVLRNFLIKGNSDEALSYLDELTGSGSTLTVGVWTGDETVDYLISSKKKLAEEKQIAFTIEVEFPRNTNIKSSDLCAILANLLDNAIEACSKVENKEKRKMRLLIRRIQQMLVIKIENTYEVMPVEEDGVYKTSKKDGGLHGFGIKSAKAAAAKYDGVLNSSFKGDLFTSVVTLSF